MVHLFDTAAKAAGLAGISTLVFYYLFRDVIRRLALPTLTRDQAYRTIRLILILVFLLALTGIGAWTYLQPRGSQASSSGPPKLTVKIKRVEHVHFLEYRSGVASLPTQTPDYSFVAGENDQAGMVMLPEGEAVYDFVVTNFGSSATVVDGVFLDLVSVHPLPPSEAGMFFPAFDPYKDSATIHHDQASYQLFYDKVLAYQAGQTDGYRINVKIANSEDSGIYKCRLRIEYRSDQTKFTSYSEPFFIGKFYGGMTNRNVYAKFHQDAQPASSTPPPLRFVDGVNFLERKDFYSTGEYRDNFVQQNMLQFRLKENAPGSSQTPDGATKSNCSWSEDTADQFVLQNAWHTLMAGPRAPIQIYGFVVDGKPTGRQIFEVADESSFISAGTDDYSSQKPLSSDNLEIYERRNGVNYSCLSLAVVAVSVESEEQRQTIGGHLVDLSRRTDIDVAGLVDLMPFLGIVDNAVTLNRVSELLTNPNPLVQVSACKVLSNYRFEAASKELLMAFLNGQGRLKRAAAEGLIMSGDNAATEVLLKKALSRNGSAEDSKTLARLIVNMDPELAKKTIGDLPLDSTFRAQLIAEAE